MTPLQQEAKSKAKELIDNAKKLMPCDNECFDMAVNDSAKKLVLYFLDEVIEATGKIKGVQKMTALKRWKAIRNFVVNDY